MEPSSAGGAAGFAAIKYFGLAAILATAAAFLAALVVMCVKRPRSAGEWVVALVSTVISSICGGAAVVVKFGVQHWIYDPFGIIALFGLVFACGLPGWALVRVAFNTIRKHEGETFKEVADAMRKTLSGGL